MTVNEGPWPFLPSESGLAMTGWSVRRSALGQFDVEIQFTPLLWRETICRWLDEQVEL